MACSPITKHSARPAPKGRVAKKKDEHQDLKRQKDLATIKGLFSLFPRQVVDSVLEEAEADRRGPVAGEERACAERDVTRRQCDLEERQQ